VDAAAASGVTIRAEAMVTGIEADRTLTVTTPQGLTHVRPGALVLATGARERPRSARMIAGDRPAGVYTTGHLQNLVHLQHGTPGQRAVVVGAELVSWSAVLTLREAGCRTVLLTTTYDRSESYRAFSALGRTVLRVPVAPRSRVVSIHGRHRVEAVTLEDLRTGTQRRVACDTVVLTGDWVPDNELARTAGLDVAPGSRSPVVDATLRTSAPGDFAVGTWSTRSTPPAWPRSTGGTSLPGCATGSGGVTQPAPACRCAPRSRCAGSRRPPYASTTCGRPEPGC
jgi:NADPH-dependent 2,4-dienoyl-CoA reductase/sulfur reductase-like enzyme